MFLYNEQRRILLIDANTRKLNLRANVLRNHEIEVHTANSLEHAESLWRTIPYDFVLLAAQENSEEAATLTARIHENKPHQRIGLLVGPPAFIREMSRLSKQRQPISRRSVVSMPAPIAQQIPTGAESWYTSQMALRVLRKVNEMPSANAS